MIKIHEYIGVDLGKTKSGLARGNNLARLAEPMMIVKTERLPEKLVELANNGVAGIVFGLPRNLSGDDTDQTRWVRQWVASLKLGASTFWQDEALTSKPPNYLSSNSVTDADSAAIILQDFLNSPINERVAC